MEYAYYIFPNIGGVSDLLNENIESNLSCVQCLLAYSGQDLPRGGPGATKLSGALSVNAINAASVRFVFNSSDFSACRLVFSDEHVNGLE